MVFTTISFIPFEARSTLIKISRSVMLDAGARVRIAEGELADLWAHRG